MLPFSKNPGRGIRAGILKGLWVNIYINIPRSTLDNNKKPLASIHVNKVETANCHSELARLPS
jgi:hypothetical protein